MGTMKAAVIDRYGEPDELRIAEVPRPRPGARDLLIRVVATSVNPVDSKQRLGTQKMIVRKEFPAILGMDLSGVVEEVGPGVSRYAPGDLVWSSPSHKRPGTWAEFACVDEAEVAPKPPSLSHEEAASLPLVALTAWECLHDGRGVGQGSRVFIQAGSGGVGTAAIQIARHAGAEVTTTCSARNAELVTSLGASRVVDYREEDYVAVVEPQDHVLESLGPHEWDRALRITRPGGEISVISTGLPEAVGRWGAVLGPVFMLGPMARAWATAKLSGVAFRPVVRHANGQTLAHIGELVEEGAIRPVIDDVLPLADIIEANRRIESGRTRGKLVIRVAS